MSSSFLIIDFGTTSTKSAHVDLHSGAFRDLQRLTPGSPAPTAQGFVSQTLGTQAVTSPTSTPSGGGRHEGSLTELLQRFNHICDLAWRTAPFDGIVLCSEMHGFVVVDTEGVPRTDYISWLDARCLETVDGSSTYDLVVARLGDDFRRLTGMHPRPGFPLLNLTHAARTGELDVDAGWVLSLPAALARLSHDGFDDADAIVEHPTMLAAMALADVEAGSCPAPQLLQIVADFGDFQARLGTPSGEGQIAGHWPGPQGLIPIYAGVGDHQCSVLGAAPEPVNDANLNLGTGSQVGIVDGPQQALFERRPYFDGRLLCAVTHIPAGRALAEYIGFLDRIAMFANGDARGDRVDFWDALARVTPDQVQGAHLDIDLALFEGARGWRHGGGIHRIVEGALTVDGYLAALMHAFVRQYVEVLAEVDPFRQLQRLVLSGGISRKLPHLRQMLQDATRYEVLPAAALDESLLGLRSLALQAAGHTTKVGDTVARFGRRCVLHENESGAPAS